MRRIYLDHGATTPPDPRVVDEMLTCLKNIFGNPSSRHTFGREARDAVEKARVRVARGLGADPREIVFTSGGSEANYLALRGAAYANRDRGRHLVASRIEHHSVLDTGRDLEREGFEVSWIPVDDSGLVNPGDVAAALRPATILVSVMLANNEVGTIQPVREIAALARSAGALVHTDAVQGFGKTPVDVRELGVDLLSISAHKIHGPKGAGALYLREGTNWRPLNRGGGQERGRRPGTENVAGIVGLGMAAELAAGELEAEAARVGALRERLVEQVLARLPRARLTGHREQRVPHNAHFLIAGVAGFELLAGLDAEGVAVSAASACAAGSGAPSHVLQAMGVPDELALGAVRVTLGRGNTTEEVDRFVDVLERLVGEIRSRNAGQKSAQG
ncbi:MAG: cysteine desulfurase family protein [Bacillota bacterium]